MVALGLRGSRNLVLTFGILALTFRVFTYPRISYSLNLKEWVRGLAALVLMFDIYTVYQQLQLQRIRRQLAEREQIFQYYGKRRGYDCGNRPPR